MPSEFPWLRIPRLSPQELQVFATLQSTIAPMFERIWQDPHTPRTVIVVPSLSLDQEELAKVMGVHHYEERLLCLLLLLRLPKAHIIYVTSQPIPTSIVDYYLDLLPGVPSHHARQRLTLFSCHDGSQRPLTEKILERPRLLRRMRAAIIAPENTHIACFNTTAWERSLAVELKVPLFGCDPELVHLGSKSHGRAIFRQLGILIPEGMEHLRDDKDISEALIELKRNQPDLLKAVVKLNEGFSGEGNAIFSFRGAPENSDLPQWIRTHLPISLQFESKSELWEKFHHKFQEMGGIVECWVEGDVKRSPSVQGRIMPQGVTQILSTHDQVLGGPSGQIYLGCAFPAAADYRLDIQKAGEQVAGLLQQKGVIGRFAVDFISVQEPEAWKHYAIEINIRKGGTTLPFLMLEFLSNGHYDTTDGLYRLPTGQPRYYYASDNVQNPQYRGLTPDDLMEILVDHQLCYNGAKQQGVVFHLMGALSEFGKLGIVCIADQLQVAEQLYHETVMALDRETSF